ncbi:hypothetical protein ACFQ2B_17780 [Streptomyces stramineus]
MRQMVAVPVVLAAGLVLAASPAHAGPPPYADYQAIAHPVVGRVGQTVEVELGVRNGGPGPAGRQGGHGAGTYEVTPPEGTTIVATPPPGGAGRLPCVARVAPAAAGPSPTSAPSASTSPRGTARRCASRSASTRRSRAPRAASASSTATRPRRTTPYRTTTPP